MTRTVLTASTLLFLTTVLSVAGWAYSARHSARDVSTMLAEANARRINGCVYVFTTTRGERVYIGMPCP